MEMRQVLAGALQDMMEKDEFVVVIDADLGKASGTMKLREAFPDRALDVGIAEQNMASVAAGLSSYGFQPWIFSFTPFATRRICDQIAISIAYAKQDVKIVGTDPGICAELNGGTHMSLEDIGVLRSIPTMVIFEPVDATQLKKALPQIAGHKGPVYVRLFRKSAPDIFTEDYEFDLFRADVMRAGADVTLACSGVMVKECLAAAETLAARGVQAEVINFHTIKPLDEKTLLASVGKTGCVVTCENHNVIGGLRSAVAEVLAEKKPVPLESVGTRDVFGEVGRFAELQEKFGMTAQDVVEKALRAVERKA
ncbi:MAG: transketolase family protein [Clostridiales bacterium]|nr:transketolase family protein [Clostridiales bacterium]